MVALTKATFLDVPVEQIDILSIVTTTTPFSIAEHIKSSALRWNTGLVNRMFEAQVEAALAEATLLTKGRLHRINTSVRACDFSCDSKITPVTLTASI